MGRDVAKVTHPGLAMSDTCSWGEGGEIKQGKSWRLPEGKDSGGQG